MFCESCGTDQSDENKFCYRCGASLTAVEVAEPIDRLRQEQMSRERLRDEQSNCRVDSVDDAVVREQDNRARLTDPPSLVRASNASIVRHETGRSKTIRNRIIAGVVCIFVVFMTVVLVNNFKTTKVYSVGNVTTRLFFSDVRSINKSSYPVDKDYIDYNDNNSIVFGTVSNYDQMMMTGTTLPSTLSSKKIFNIQYVYFMTIEYNNGDYNIQYYRGSIEVLPVYVNINGNYVTTTWTTKSRSMDSGVITTTKNKMKQASLIASTIYYFGEDA